MEKVRLLEKAGKLRETGPIAQRCVDLAREAFEDTDARIGESLEVMGDVSMERSEPENASRFYSQCLERCDAAMEPERHARLASRLGSISQSLGDNAQADYFLKLALGPANQAESGQPGDRAGIANSLAMIAWETGDVAAAEAHYQMALEACEQRGEPGEEDAAIILNNLGILYFNSERLEDAEAMHRRAYDLRRGRTRPDPAGVAQSAGNLAVVYHSRQLHVEAQAHYETSLAAAEAAGLGNSDDHVTALLNYAQLLREMNQPKRARQIEARIAKLRR